jgi:Outer membrane protein beta-barrel domain
MMKKLLITILLSIAPIYVWAQGDQNSEPNISSTTATKSDTHKSHSDQLEPPLLPFQNYGSLVIDWGLDSLSNNYSAMDTSVWSSRFINVYCLYNVRLGRSCFTISPGIGLAFDGYQFKDASSTLVRDDPSNRNTVFTKADDLLPKGVECIESSLDVRYLDFLALGTRFSTNSQYPKEGFFLALGLKLGILWHASTTMKYKEDDMVKVQTNVETFNLNPWRFGFHARLGWGRFGICYTQTLSDFFEEAKGPGKTTKKPCHLGISIDLL